MNYSSDELNEVTIHRFHSRKHLPQQPWNLLHFFKDGGFLVKQQGRFAGAGLNPGYFFSLTPGACIFEMLYYNRVRLARSDIAPSIDHIFKATTNAGEERVFLSCEGSFQGILNLLWPKTLWGTLRKAFPRMQEPSAGVDSGTVLLELASAAMGGTLLTDVIGKYAYKNYYNGVRFPSARALEIHTSRPWSAGPLRDRLRYGAVGDESYEFDDLLQEIHAQATNVVIFRGAYILQSVKRFKIQTVQGFASNWQDNEFFGLEEYEIEKQFIAAGGWCAEDVYSDCDGMIINPNITFGKQ